MARLYSFKPTCKVTLAISSTLFLGDWTLFFDSRWLLPALLRLPPPVLLAEMWSSICFWIFWPTAPYGFSGISVIWRSKPSDCLVGSVFVAKSSWRAVTRRSEALLCLVWKLDTLMTFSFGSFPCCRIYYSISLKIFIFCDALWALNTSSDLLSSTGSFVWL